MAWSRVKTILIAMLVAVNAFLILFYGINAWRENRYKDQYNQDLLATAAALGISLDEELTQPEVEKLLPIYVYRNERKDFEIAKKLLGECETNEAEDGTVVFISRRGRLALSKNGQMELSLLETTPKDEKDAVGIVKKTLRTLEQKYETVEVLQPDDGVDFCIRAKLTAVGMPVFNAALTFEFYEGRLSVGGRRILYDPQQVRSAEIRELPGLLLSLFGHWDAMGELDKTITGIDLGYLVKNMNGKRVTVLPVWRVSEEACDWYINAMDGSVISAE